jgi:hypothetical protein
MLDVKYFSVIRVYNLLTATNEVLKMDRKNWKEIVLDVGIGTVSDIIGMHYETVRGAVLGGKQPGRELILRLIKYIDGVTVDDFLDNINTERRTHNHKAKKANKG